MSISIHNKIIPAILVLFLMPMFLQAQPAINAQERILALKKQKMQEYLQLGKSEAEEFFQTYESFAARIHFKTEEINLSVKKLAFSIEHGNESELVERTNEVDMLQKELADLMFEIKDFAKLKLNKIQYAKFIVFENKFNSELRKRMMQGGGRGPGGPGMNR